MTTRSSMLPNSRYSPPIAEDGKWRRLLKRVWFYRFYYLLALPGILYFHHFSLSADDWYRHRLQGHLTVRWRRRHY